MSDRVRATPWLVLGVVWLMLGAVYGLFLSFTIFFVALIEEFRWSRGLTAGAFSLATVIQGVLSPGIGLLVDRIGPRRVILAGLLLLSSASMLASRIQSPWQLYVVVGVLVGIGVTAVGWVPTGALLARLFVRHRGRVMGLAFSGMGVGILAFGPLAQWLIAQHGWRQAYLILGGGTLLCLGPLLWFGVSEGASQASPAKGPPVPQAAGPGVLAALSMRQFWGLFLAYFFTPLAVFPVFTHQVAFAVDLGYPRMFVAGIFGLTGFMSSLGRILFGTVSDWIGRESAATLSFACTATGIGALILLETWPHPGWLYAYALLFGLGFGARGPIITAMAAELFAGRRFGLLYGIMNLGNGLGGAIGPWFGGMVHDLTGSYRPAFLTAVGFCAVASTCFWVARTRSRGERR
ncbi:MAG: MFS transporter [Candidatus Rokubacteria bacterium]|nr:MFS transporter [Candidatus Rokubacteria bacterium]